MALGSVTRLPRQKADHLHGAPRRRAGTAGTPAVPPPRRAAGLELLGRFADSGLKKPPYLVRRADGQVLQLSHLLYLVVEAADGTRDTGAIADAVGERTGRSVSADNVQFLIDRKLRPMGVLTTADGSEPQAEKHAPLIALRRRRQILPATGSRVLAALFAPMFWPPIVVAVLGAIAALDAWLFFSHGIGGGMRAALYNPVLLFLIFGSIIVATAFHEIGHAAACRYGGARPGPIGAAIYLIWPAFYCDVTDSYRLSRTGRLRTDLGGVYFNGIFALLTAGAFFATGQQALLVVITVQHLIVVQQLLPLLRFDGYYVLSDLTGLPDVLSRIGPVFRSLNPFGATEPKAAELKLWARAAVVAYVVLLVPLAVLAIGWVIIGAPRLFATIADSLALHLERAAAEVAARDWSGLATDGLQIPALLLPCLGMTFTAVRLSTAFAGAVQRWSAGSRPRKAVAVGSATAIAFFLIVSWGPNGSYVPLQPDERGTLQAALPPMPMLQPASAVEQPVPAAEAIAQARERAGAVAPYDAVAPRATEAPATPVTEAPDERDVGEPRDPARTGRGVSSATAAPPAPGAEAQASITPPAPAPTEPATTPPPEEEPEPEPTVEIPAGDQENYAIAINTEDAAQIFELAFALQTIGEGRVEHKNIARAYARCEGCRTIAIAVQIVLITAEIDYVVPWNIAQAVNDGCTACETLAAAHQLVFTTGGEVRLKQSARDEIDRLERELAALEHSDASIPEIENEVDRLVAELREVVLDGLVPVEDDPDEAPAADEEAAEEEPPSPSEGGDGADAAAEATEDGSGDDEVTMEAEASASTTPEPAPEPAEEADPAPATVPETTEVPAPEDDADEPEPAAEETTTTSEEPTTTEQPTTTGEPTTTTTTTDEPATTTTPSEEPTTTEEPATTPEDPSTTTTTTP